MNTIKILTLVSFISAFYTTINAQDYLSNQDLKFQKTEAVTNEQYRLVKVIQEEINKREAVAVSLSTPPKSQQIIDIEKKQKEAVINEDWALAKSIKRQKNSAMGITEVVTAPVIGLGINPNNLRETAFREMKTTDYATTNSYIKTPSNPVSSSTESASSTKLKNSEENTAGQDLKYRRSSLYTLMINDEERKYAPVIKDAFGNSRLPQKFNDHNIGPYMINAEAALKDQSEVITSYLNTNNVAKNIVSKWFNRSADGKFNMNLIAARGMYDASSMDKVIANSTERGNSMLADAGEELISKTFVIINDFKYINKEEAVASAKKKTSWIKAAAGYVPGAGGAIQKGIGAAETAATVAGKGYWVRTTSYLYRLEWNEETEAIFYNNYWTDVNDFDPAKVEAYNNATNFNLRLVGFQTAGADVQSSIFTNKSEEDLIRMATVKATDRAIAKLEKKYEEFRTKTPLYSGSPITAKIGVKEGLEAGDKFEVLQQEIDLETGKTIYKRVGIIKVDGNNIWDNSFSPEETEQLRIEGKLPEQQYTIFSGSGKFYPGQLIKQIN